MSRSGYSDEGDYHELYRATVRRSLRGKRSQAFLRDMAAALDAMPIKELIAGELVTSDGACCAIGAVCKARAIDVSKVYYDDPWAVAKLIGVSTAMAAEIAYLNDDYPRVTETPSQRWERMRRWVAGKIEPI